MLSGKNTKVVAFSAILATSVGFGIARAWAVEGVVSKDIVSATAVDSENSYCHLKFPAIEPSSLATDHPVLQSADSVPPPPLSAPPKARLNRTRGRLQHIRKTEIAV